MRLTPCSHLLACSHAGQSVAALLADLLARCEQVRLSDGTGTLRVQCEHPRNSQVLAPSKPADTAALRLVPAEPGWRVQLVPAEHYRSHPKLCFTPVMQPDLDLEHHDWRSYANCAGTDNPDQFNPTNGGYRVNETIREYCDPCPVKAQCEALAVRNGDEGVYGGTTGQERRSRGLRLREAARARGAAARDAAAVDMVNAGHPATEVAEALGVSHRTVLRATAKAREAVRAS